MFIGKWNKSVILTYVGLIISILGIYICFNNFEKGINLAISCLIVAGTCDLFDGYVARKCKRTDEEKNFGIELDSLVDTIAFIALPVSIYFKLQMNCWYHFIVIATFAICGIARLAYFNIITADNTNAIEYYTGVPITYIAMALPTFYLLQYIISLDVFKIVFPLLILSVAISNISNIKVKKPKGICYIILPISAILMLALYLGVL